MDFWCDVSTACPTEGVWAVTHHVLELWRMAFFVPRQMRHGLNQTPRAPKEGGQIQEMQVRVSPAIATF